MERQAIFPPGRPNPNPPYSPGIRLGNLLFTAGQVGADATGKTPSDIRDQTRTVFENLKAVLTAGGSGLEHVLKATVYLTDIKEFAAMNEVYGRFFKELPPARATVEAARLPRDARVEIEAIALAS